MTFLRVLFTSIVVFSHLALGYEITKYLERYSDGSISHMTMDLICQSHHAHLGGTVGTMSPNVCVEVQVHSTSFIVGKIIQL